MNKKNLSGILAIQQNHIDFVIISDMKYHIWTEGCQMNVADTQRVSSALEYLGYQSTEQPEHANVIVLNTCVVRQSAEDKAYGRLNSLRPLKSTRPDLVINLMGCLVGVKPNDRLRQRFPFVDVFSPPSDPGPLVAFLTQDESRDMEYDVTQQRFAAQNGDLLLPRNEQGKLISAFIPAVLGCSHACTFCIIPYRRGVERSRSAQEIIAEARSLAKQGVREVTLLGQIVDRYGQDVPGGPNLAELLRSVQEIEDLLRIRFLTSHPNWISDELLDVVAELPKVMHHIEVPVQSGDDLVLENMKRGYTADDYRQLIARIRERIPGVSIATDIIVGFPGERESQFENTYNLLADLALDVVHIARYSPRSGTVAERRMPDDVPEEEKWSRFRLLEELQEKTATQINSFYLGKVVEVLFEQKARDRWRGRTPTNKLVFVQSSEELKGKLKNVRITWTGPWSMQGAMLDNPESTSF